MPLDDEHQAKFDAVCERIADGESVRQICRDGDNPPCGEMTFYRWLQDDETGALADKYRLAREIQAERIAEDILSIADDARNDWMARKAQGGGDGEGGDGEGFAFNHEHVQRSKLRIESRKWLASKLKPKVYGDKLDLSHGLQEDTDIAAIRAELKQMAATFGFALPPALIGEKDGEPDDGA